LLFDPKFLNFSNTRDMLFIILFSFGGFFMKKLTAILLVLLLAGSLFARGAQGSGSGGAGGATMIGLAMPETHVLRWIKDGNSLKAEAEKRGYRAEVQWADANQAIQNQQIQSFLTQGAKALVVGNVNDGVVSVVAEAARDKVVVVAYDRIIQNSTDYDYFITFNNFKVGVLQGQSLEAAMNLPAATAAAPKNITLFAGSPTDANANFFFDGAMSILNPYIEKGVLRVIGPYPKTHADNANFQRIATENWQAPIAKTRMENLLNNDARDVVLDAVLAPNDPLARAIIEACKADAKYRTRLPAVSGQDAEFDSAMSIKNGEQTSTVFKDTAKLAEAAILLIDQVLKGQTPNIPGAVLASGDLREIGNTGRKYVNCYLLDPILVTRNNLNVPVDAGFYEADQAAQLR
jgi:putative multiple sugar transport system substrate-binding protein